MDNRELRLGSDRPLGHLAQMPSDGDRLAGQHEPRGVEQYLVLCGTDLRLDDLDGQILLLAADQSRDSIPDARGALVGGPWRHPSRHRGSVPRLRADMAATLIGRATDVEVQSTALAAPGGNCCDTARRRARRRLRSLSHTRRLDQAWLNGGAVAA